MTQTQSQQSFPKIYNLYFIYHAHEKSSCLKDAWRPQQPKCWHQDFFMIPRSGDIILYEGIWWTVEKIFLCSDKLYEIQVEYYGHR